MICVMPIDKNWMGPDSIGLSKVGLDWIKINNFQDWTRLFFWAQVDILERKFKGDEGYIFSHNLSSLSFLWGAIWCYLISLWKNKSLFALTKFQELELCQESFKIQQKPLNNKLFLFFQFTLQCTVWLNRNCLLWWF